MLGFSFPKLLLLLIILILIWYFFNYLEKKSKDPIKEKEQKDNNEEELTECYKCGGFYYKLINNRCPMCDKINKK
ncbi:MAG: hypothetical protein CMJ06_04960 [Pelagibacterales bacterium]|nr:hypothetical protein [Pelagibacterales bacterium]OUU61793.1 MAG: hypothetical protein CBC22_06410 [Alphaproteobacteria bacterium TMED62]|tara:strand:- start:7430 stop:7654 length:225 start_codon:yes stop_codon:yes gene_type:complete